MLAILMIDVTYRNYNRNAQSADERKKFMTPVRIDDGVELQGEGIFF